MWITSLRRFGALLALCVLAACGGDDEDSIESATVSGAATTTATSVPGTVAPDATAAPSSQGPAPEDEEDEGDEGGVDEEQGEEDDDEAPYVVWGPDDPPIPEQYGALAASSASDLDCDRSESSVTQPGPFWASVVAVCRALRGDAEWPEEIVTVAADGGNDFQRCMNEELAAMMAGLADWRARHPGENPRVRFPPGDARSPCELGLYDLAVFPVGDGEDRPGGGIVIEIQVPGLVEDAEVRPVRVDGHEVVLEDDFDGAGDGLSFGQVFVPAPISAHRATVEVDTYFATLRGEIDVPAVDTESPNDHEDAPDTTSGTADPGSGSTSPPASDEPSG